jgi:hypothetical protein
MLQGSSRSHAESLPVDLGLYPHPPEQARLSFGHRWAAGMMAALDTNYFEPRPPESRDDFLPGYSRPPCHRATVTV